MDRRVGETNAAANSKQRACKREGLPTPLPHAIRSTEKTSIQHHHPDAVSRDAECFIFPKRVFSELFHKAGNQQCIGCLIICLSAIDRGFSDAALRFSCRPDGQAAGWTHRAGAGGDRPFYDDGGGLVQSKMGAAAHAHVDSDIFYRRNDAGSQLVCLAESDYSQRNPRPFFREAACDIYDGIHSVFAFDHADAGYFGRQNHFSDHRRNGLYCPCDPLFHFFPYPGVGERT